MKNYLHIPLISFLVLFSFGCFAQTKEEIVTNVPVYFAHATQAQQGQGLGNAVDGSMSTNYHSAYVGGTLPDTLDFTFIDVARIDSMTYFPRQSGGSNGNFENIEIYYSTNEAPETFTKFGKRNFNKSSSPTGVLLGSAGISNPSTIRVIVMSGQGNFASCAEMTFTGVMAPWGEQCDPTDLVTMDKQITVSSGKASNYQPDSGEGPIELSFDNNPSTMYHSNWSGGGFPITLDYNFTDVTSIDYLVYQPRMSGENGLFKEVEISYSTTANPTTFEKLYDLDFKASKSATKVLFDLPLENPATVRVVVKDGFGNYASCAEMGFYKISGGINNPPAGIFTDKLCKELLPEVTIAQIEALDSGFYKTLAQGIFEGTYDINSRYGSYRPYSTVGTAVAKMKTNGLSSVENPTGIYFEAGDLAVVLVGETDGQKIGMTMYETDTWARSSYALEKGVNRIPITTTGLLYIDYYNDDYASLSPIEIHVSGGKVNGVFKSGETTPAQWRNMLAHSPSAKIDVIGKYTQLIYPVIGFKQYSPNDAQELIEFYDSITNMQYDMLGLNKYGRTPENHMLCIASAVNGGWYGGGYAHFGGGIDATCSAVNAKENPWGIAHEIGHVNTGGHMKVVSTTEVMNNVFSIWSHYVFSTNFSRKLEQEDITDAFSYGSVLGNGAYGTDMNGGRFNAYLNNGILAKEQWLCQFGPDAMGKPESEWRFGNGDHFVKLCPLWQLELYYQAVNPEKKDWFADSNEAARNVTGNITQGKKFTNMLKFICDAVQADLTDFFIKAGMLRTYNKFMLDYGSEQLTVTAADSAAVHKYIEEKGYEKPATPVLYYLSANSVDAYKNKLAVEGEFNTGLKFSFSSQEDHKRYVTANHDVWKNVTVFETYKGENLVRLSMVGTDTRNNSSTRIYYPKGATAIYAVAWDGTKTLVYGKATSIEENNTNGATINIDSKNGTILVEGVDENSQLTINDISGKTVAKHTVSHSDVVSVSELPNGAYIANVVSNNISKSIKILKQ